MPMELVARPRSANRMRQDIIQEVEAAYGKLGKEVVIPRLVKDVQNWSKIPDFWFKVLVTNSLWQITFGYNKDTDEGLRYKWVDEGTSVRGGKSTQPYDILPKKGKALRYYTPHYPKTVANVVGTGAPGIVMSQGTQMASEVVRAAVKHPGIWPRNFTESLRAELSDRNRPGGFKRITDAAVKRAVRKRSK